MGVVYMAEQEQVIRRRVALKIIKPGMDTDQVIARFEAERQALALMDHQNIAKVLDAGTTGSGRPYFVMELVRGVPITEYCDQNRLTPRERLELFVPVCQAIQHAHQKGIIHRDVKPSNVLVTLHDGKPVPKIIDFGVAKAIDQRLTERTLFTQFGAIIGTWEYMSPESAAGGSGLDVDTRSDIYSLGVLLYELLTGSTPLERAQLRQAAYSEILRKIRDEEPPKPSTRLSESRDALPAISAQRKTEPAKLAKLVRGELDWIVMKALEKDRTRRYETANGLARDIERYLGGDPVEAGPPSAGYRLRKFARKYRTPLRLVAAVGLLLTVAAVLSTWQAIRASRAERAARQERDRAVEAESEAKAVVDFLRNDLLAQASSNEQARTQPGTSPDPEIKVRTLLDRASERIGGKFTRQPLVEATIRETIGYAYMHLGRIGSAVQHSERALDLRRRELSEELPVMVTAMVSLSWLYMIQGRINPALTLGTKSLELSRKIYGENHLNTLVWMIDLGYVFMVSSKYAEAESLLTRARESCRRVLGEEHFATIYATDRLGVCLLCQGRLEEAESLLTKNMEVSRRVLGEENITIYGLGELGEVYLAQGKYILAEPLLTRAVETSRRVMGAEHYYTQWLLRQLGRSYQFQGEIRQAESLLTKSLGVSRRLWDDEYAYTQLAIGDMVKFYLAQDRYAEARPLISRWLEVNHGESSGESLFWPWAMSYLAWLLANSPESSGDRDPTRAVELAKKAVAASPQEASFWHTLGVAHYRAGDWKAAMTALEKSMELPTNPWVGRIDSTDKLFLAVTHWQLGHHDQARHWYDQAISWMEARKRRDPELLRFRAEAAALLGIQERPKPNPK
jgi:tetratricopeptide (TPR) repeat protein/tRNA A-37 threonylcarbamoyl transferase component Bud32